MTKMPTWERAEKRRGPCEGHGWNIIRILIVVGKIKTKASKSIH